MITELLRSANPSEQRMPGTKAKQASALAYNIKWLAEEFGVECVGFLTLTVGDTVNGKFVHVKERAEASRRFNSILNRIRERYRCGVVVTERHKNGGIHFHLVVALPFDARTGFDFEEFYRLKKTKAKFRAEDVGASCELAAEWRWWRENQAKYGFGRHELTPIKSNGEAIGRYVGKYLGKSWEARTDDDFRGRCVRYFGRWSKAGVKCGPPMSCRHGTTTPRAQAWREAAKQVQWLTKQLGAEINEQNIKEHNGPRWAWHFTKQIQRIAFVVPQTRGSEALRQGIEKHNEGASPSEEAVGCYRPSTIGVWDTNIDYWWRESPVAASKRYVREAVGGRRYRVKCRREYRETVARLWAREAQWEASMRYGDNLPHNAEYSAWLN